MTLLRLHGVPWDANLCSYAAFLCKLPLLQWLHSNECPMDEQRVLRNASRGGSVGTLEWLLTVTAPWSDSTKAEMLKRAAWCGKLATAQWLRTRGARWPQKFAGQCSDCVTNDTINECWSLTAVQRALASDSGWLDWHCEEFAAARFSRRFAKQHAADVLEWAHANGCPCTCGQQQ
jgi:hypothetical protein